MKESDFQARLIRKLKTMLPGCIVLKNDPCYIQGFPDLTVLYGKHWAILECKRSANAPRQPNQEYYVKLAGDMSFGRFVSPENEEEVLRDIQQAFGVRGETLAAGSQ